MLDIAILIAATAIGGAMLAPRLRRNEVWRAMITPLASIIGSGFLVLGPILGNAYGWAAPIAMAALCAVSWAFGGAIRSNIATIQAHPAAEHQTLERISSAVLGFAFVISVAYYLNLFGAFALSMTPYSSAVNVRILTTLVFGVILVTGWSKGFAMLERMEYLTVTLKLAIIAGLILGLVHFNGVQAMESGLRLYPVARNDWGLVTLLFGLIVTVQGFETTRYLGEDYSAPTRIKAMRLATVIAAGIYLVYILLLTFAFDPALVPVKETAVVGMLADVAPILPFLLIAAALAAQFSASVADTGGAGGLISELSNHRLKPREAYLVVVALGVAITWAADVFQIIAYASRAFAAYYGLQALIAAGHNRHAPAKAAWFLALAFLGAVIVIFGEAVE